MLFVSWGRILIYTYKGFGNTREYDISFIYVPALCGDPTARPPHLHIYLPLHRSSLPQTSASQLHPRNPLPLPNLITPITSKRNTLSNSTGRSTRRLVVKMTIGRIDGDGEEEGGEADEGDGKLHFEKMFRCVASLSRREKRGRGKGERCLVEEKG